MGGKIEKNTQEKNDGKNKSKMSILWERGSIIIREKPEGKTAVSMSKQCMRHKTFQLEYKNNACWPGAKEKIVEIAMNGGGTRDTGRVLRISPNTVTAVLKKRKITQNRSMKTT